MWSVVALRLTCRHLNRVYIDHEDSIRPIMVNRIVAPFYDFFEFLVRLKLPENSVMRPPPSGWPNLTVRNRDDLTEVGRLFFDVLSQLPAIPDHRPDYATDYKSFFLLGPNSQADNTSLEVWQRATQRSDVPMRDPKDRDDGGETYQIPTELLIAQGHESGGVNVYLDVLTSRIREDIIRMGPGGGAFVWEYFADKRRSYEDLDYIFHPESRETFLFSHREDTEPYDGASMEARGEPILEEYFGGDDDHDEDYLWVRHLYRKFGWPGESWQKEEALAAIDDYVERRNNYAWSRDIDH